MPVRKANGEDPNETDLGMGCVFMSFLAGTVKPVLSSHSKIGKKNVLKTDGSLMKVESIGECSNREF